MHFKTIRLFTVLLFALLQLNSAHCAVHSAERDGSLTHLGRRSVAEDCDQYDINCFKIYLIRMIDAVSKWNEYRLWRGLSVVADVDDDNQDDSDRLQEIAKAFPDSPEDRINSVLAYKVVRLLKSRSLKLNLIDQEDVPSLEMENMEDGARSLLKKKKLKKGLILLLLSGGLKVVGALFMVGLFLLAKKALFTSLLALAISTIVAIKYKVGEAESIFSRIGKNIFQEKSQGEVNLNLPENLRRTEYY